jgi:hypothetical protein
MNAQKQATSGMSVVARSNLLGFAVGLATAASAAAAGELAFNWTATPSWFVGIEADCRAAL